MKNEPIESHDPQLTAYAIGEMTPSAQLVFEQQLKNSPKAAKELAEIEETIGWLRDGFASEMCTPRPKAAPLGQATAYALGEMSGIEKESFERLVKESPAVAKELAGIQETVGWLSEGFAAELISSPAAAATSAPLVLLNSSPAELKIVEGNFKRPSMRVMLTGLAAVLAAMLVVGSMIEEKSGSSSDPVAAVAENGMTTETIQVQLPVLAASDGSPASASRPIDGFTLTGFTGGVEQPESSLSSTLASASIQKDPTSYLDFENMSATPLMEIDPAKMSNLNSLPGLSALNSGEPSFGKYLFKNEGSDTLPDDEYGHGNLSFEIRTLVEKGRLIEKIRLIDTRTNPDGTTNKTVKEFVREGSEVGKPIDSLLNQGAVNGKEVQVVAAVEPASNIDPSALILEFSKINAELETVRDALSKSPTGVKLVELELKLTDLISRQSALGHEMEARFGSDKK